MNVRNRITRKSHSIESIESYSMKTVSKPDSEDPFQYSVHFVPSQLGNGLKLQLV